MDPVLLGYLYTYSSTDDVILLERSESRLWIRDINPARLNAEGDGVVDVKSSYISHDQLLTVKR